MSKLSSIDIILNLNIPAKDLISVFLKSDWKFQIGEKSMYLDIGDKDDFDWKIGSLSIMELNDIIYKKDTVQMEYSLLSFGIAKIANCRYLRTVRWKSIVQKILIGW